MQPPKQAELERLRKRYPVGMRIQLILMKDPQAPPPNTKGTVKGVDDMGHILVSWDNGSSLSVIPGKDIIRRILTEE